MTRVWTFNGGDVLIAPRFAHLTDKLDEVLHMPDLELCKIMKEEGSNKSDRMHHRYTPFYDALFHDLNPNLVFEIGVGSKNPRMRFAMQPHNVEGGSLRGWRRYFPNAKIYGADYDTTVLFQEDRIKTFYVDQLNSDSIQRMWVALLGSEGLGLGSFDLILDDAVHEPAANQNFFVNSISVLRIGGWYVIEDLERRNPSMMDDHRNFLSQLPYPSMIVDIPNPNFPVNNCFAAILKTC